MIPLIALRDVVVFPGNTVYLEIGRKKTIRAIKEAMHGEKRIVAVAQRNPETEDPELHDLYSIGTLSEVKQIVTMPDKVTRVVLVGKERIQINHLEEVEDCLYSDVEEYPNLGDLAYSLEVVAMIRGLKDIFSLFAKLHGKLSDSFVEEVMNETELVAIIDRIAADIPVHYQLKQHILAEQDVYQRHEALALLLTQEIGIMRIQRDIMGQVKEQVDKNQKDYYLREQIKAIHKELGEEDALSDSDKYREQLNKLKAPKKVKKKISQEIDRFKKMSSSSSESTVIRGYIETLLAFPWKKTSKEELDVNLASQILNEDHYGLEKIKERVLECLSVKALNSDGNSPIICLVGPPGTGKTSIAKSIARALNRKYIRICLGGVRDEAEIRGHRRTYVGAMPGRIVKGLMNAKVKNPVMLLDEIDKMSNDHKGDPASALLEVLDPEQNSAFSDHYMEMPVDLSKVMFICTANTLDTISRPLLDRMEVIKLPGYTANEKMHIASDYLIDKQIIANGLTKNQFTITDKALERIILRYTKEAGVRGLEQKISSLCRKAAKEIAMNSKNKLTVSNRNLVELLGKEIYSQDMVSKKGEIGLVRGLAWTSVGGDTLEIEVNITPGTGKIELTGKLGDVMQESARIALTYVKSQLGNKVKEDYFEKHDIHLHVPEGAVPKDGPSAGVTMATAIYSAITKQAVLPEVAMTGELSLRGRVLAIGGLKEKLLAAKLAGVTTVFVPASNEKDVHEIEQEIKDNLEIIFVKNVKEIWNKAILLK